MNRQEILPGLEVAYLGPPLSEGPLPALFYFALSDRDSLCLDPFNQPAAYLSSLPMRIFSMTLPAHENNLNPLHALNAWAAEIAFGNNVIADFVHQVKRAVEKLIETQVLLPDRLAVAGLSRGAFIAAHAAAIIPEFQWILGFASLTKLSAAKEFENLIHHPIVKSLSLEHLVPKLNNRTLRFYIGNLDSRVGTRNCFDFIESLSLSAFENKIRSPSVELLIKASIGRDGHGTSEEIFHEGAQWIAEQLKAIHVV